ncbi:unnamed protein product [Rotaria sp. Silwood2]|nr:unnamed protein product [Rotaria sp. Silwood2]
MQLDFDIDIDDMEDEQDNREEIPAEDVICWPTLKEKIPSLLNNNTDLDSFEKFYLQFLLDLREGHSLPQNIVQAVTSGVKSLIEFIFELLKGQVKSSSIKDQRTACSYPTTNFILLSDVKNIVSSVIERMNNITKNEHRFVRLCKKYFSYDSPKEIKLENPNEVAYYIPMQSTIKQMLSNPYVLDILIKNFNQIINRNACDHNLMYDYRHASQAKQHPVLTNKPDSLLFHIYIDEIGLTNPIGAKKDTQKITMLYFQLNDLPDIVRSKLKSIGLLAMCHSSYLSNTSNRIKFFQPIVEDLNTLQTTGLYIPGFGTQLNFAFTIVAGDHLGLNDIGGFQKNFSNGQFCRHCHINYDQRLIPLSQVSYSDRTRDHHDSLVQQVINSNNHVILQGVVDISPFSNLIGFHATTSLPNDLMHDFNEGLCSQILLAMIKEASTKRILSYGEVEDRLMSFEYGLNDKSNKPPVLLKKHLNKGKIVGTASQKMCLFKLFPIVFHDIIDQLDTKEIYICLREIISHVYASPFPKSWLPYLHHLTVRFQSLMVHLLPNFIISKVHFITHYAKQVEMYGPPIRYWCMRFESKHQIFKQLAVKSNNFKNILYTLSKRHQLRQCLLLSLSDYYKIMNEGYSSAETNLYALPADVREDIDGETLFNLPESIMYEIIKPIKERVRFLTEHRALFENKFHDTCDEITLKKYVDDQPVNSSQQVIEQDGVNQFMSMSTTAFSNNDRSNPSTLDSSTDSEVMNQEAIMSPHEDNDNENYEDEEQPRFPVTYHISDLPPKLQQLIDKGNINCFRSHTNARRLLLDAVFTNVTTKYSLMYPDTHEYRSMGRAILEKLNIKNDINVLNDWVESLKSKFKRERRPLQQMSEEILKMKLKFGNRAGRPVKQSNNVIAARREVHVEIWNKTDANDDPQEFDEHIQFMKNELTKENFNFDGVKNSWKKTLVNRRLYIQNHTTIEVLQEYPGYSNVFLIFDEIQYLCNVDIEANFRYMIPKLLTNIPDSSGFVDDLSTIRLIKLLSRYFTDSWQHILTYKDPLSPRPTIQVTTDKFLIYLDYNVVTETLSIDQALCIVISLYFIFELQFGSHNRTINLLYGILLQEPAILTKQLRFTLKQWNFQIDKKEHRKNTQLVNYLSTNSNTSVHLIKNLQHFEESERDCVSNEEPHEHLIEKTDRLNPLIEAKKQSFKYGFDDDLENSTTTITIDVNKDRKNNYSATSSQSFTSSTPTIDSQLLMQSSKLKQRNIETSTSVVSKESSLYSVKIQHEMVKTPNEIPRTELPIHIAQTKKRLRHLEEPAPSRSKRTKKNK